MDKRSFALGLLCAIVFMGSHVYRNTVMTWWEGGVQDCRAFTIPDFADTFDLIQDPNHPGLCAISLGTQVTQLGSSIEAAELPAEAGRTDVEKDYTVSQTFSAGVSLGENAINSSEFGGLASSALFCGDMLDDTDNYLEPALDLWWGGAGATCTGKGNTTRTSAEATVLEENPLKVTGMACHTSGITIGAVDYTIKDDAGANLDPTVTCTIALGDQSCVTETAITTDVPAGEKLSIEQVIAEGVDETVKTAHCRVFFTMKAN